MSASLNQAQRSVVDTLRAHWRLYVFEGLVMIVLGVLAIAFPVFATLAVDLYLGWLFLFCGIFADLLAPHGANQISPINRLKPPSWAFPFGTDNLGRDVLSRCS